MCIVVGPDVDVIAHKDGHAAGMGLVVFFCVNGVFVGPGSCVQGKALPPKKAEKCA